MILCSLYDRKACSFSPAVAYPDTATAERAFIGLLSSGESTPAQWPDDFCLYSVGSFDPSTGSVAPSQPQALLTGQGAMTALTELRRRQARGGAVGGTASAVPPEDSGASAERDDTPSLFDEKTLDASSDPSSNGHTL